MNSFAEFALVCLEQAEKSAKDLESLTKKQLQEIEKAKQKALQDAATIAKLLSQSQTKSDSQPSQASKIHDVPKYDRKLEDETQAQLILDDLENVDHSNDNGPADALRRKFLNESRPVSSDSPSAPVVHEAPSHVVIDVVGEESEEDTAENVVDDAIESETDDAAESKPKGVSALLAALPDNWGSWLLLLAAGTGIALVARKMSRGRANTLSQAASIPFMPSESNPNGTVSGFMSSLTQSAVRGNPIGFSFGGGAATADGRPSL